MQSNMPKNQVILVDDYDQPIGQAEKHFAHEEGFLHRAISVVILRCNGNNEIEVLMQQRASGKYHAPECWSNSCCSHPFPKESIYDAATRRTKEELGMSLPLIYLDRLTYKAKVSPTMIEHEIDHIFVGIDRGGLIQPNPDEVKDIKWLKLDDFKHRMRSIRNHYSFSPWCQLVMQVVLNHRAKIASLL